MTLTPNTQITQENVEALEVALSQAKRGADKAGCDGWRAQEMCRQIVQLLEPVVNRPALSPPAEDPFVGFEEHIAAIERSPEYLALGPLTPPAEGEVRMTDEEWEDRCTCCDNTGITIQTERRCACQPPLTPTPSPVDWNVVGPKLVEALREIVDQCPATCETSDAHTMADIAREALANQRSSVDLNAVAKDAAERAGKNASVAPQLLFAHILWALQDAFPALAAAQPGAGE